MISDQQPCEKCFEITNLHTIDIYGERIVWLCLLCRDIPNAKSRHKLGRKTIRANL